jgi:hypothetical protein
MIDNLKFSKVMIIFTIVSSTVAGKAWGSSNGRCRCWNLPKPLLLGSKNSTRSDEGQRPNDHALNILVII